MGLNQAQRAMVEKARAVGAGGQGVALTEGACAYIEAEGGEAFVGDSAWQHLSGLAGPTMAKFLKLYAHMPMQAMVGNTTRRLPSFTIRMATNDIAVSVGGESFRIGRAAGSDSGSPGSRLPDDVDEETTGP